MLCACTLGSAPSVPLRCCSRAGALHAHVPLAPQRSVLLEVFDSDQGTLVLGRLNLYELVRLHNCISKWLKGTGWVPAYAASRSPAQKKLICDRTPFTNKVQLVDTFCFAPAWFVEAFAKELTAKQVDFNKPEERALREQHEALATRRRNINTITRSLERNYRLLDTHDQRLQRELGEVRQEYESERQTAGQQIADCARHYPRQESPVWLPRPGSHRRQPAHVGVCGS